MKLMRWMSMVMVAILMATVFVGVGATVGPVSRAQAVTGAGFDAGNIIDDSLFYDGAAMTAGAVQTFLTSKGGAIRNLNLRTPNMAAESGLCNTYAGVSAESVATVIAKIGAACGISQKVLLVLLQKEQHLISATAPDQWTLDHATGFACPDSAPCDAAYSGFFYQVWYAARQFKLYALHPTWYNHIAGRVNDVRYHPNAGCGTSPVYIYNVATAGLYNYTPYQPDNLALQNIYGTGGGCSSYGNRNFWAIYTDWFGATTAASGGVGALHASLGGASGALGAVYSGIEHWSGSGGGTAQRFTGGSIMSSPTYGTWAMLNGPIRDEYWAKGGPNGIYGWPTEAAVCPAGACSQAFSGGLITDLIGTLHASMGGNAGPLGAATGGAAPYTGNGGGVGQRFVGGSIMSSPTYGTWAIVNGPIRDEYWLRGGPAGAVGWPTANQVCALGVCSQTFSGGTISNAISTLQASMGGDTGALGPASGPAALYLGNGDGIGQRFANGSIMSSLTYGTWAILNGAIRDEYWAQGGPSGTIGWPTANQVCTGATCSQTFSGGTISKAASLPTQIAALHLSLGGNSGVLGRPTGAPGTYLGNGDGIGQRFDGGSVMASPIYGAWAVLTGPIRDEYWARGGPAGSIGWPTANQVCAAGICSQTFSGGTLNNQTAALTTQIATMHTSLGGNTGPLGRPTGSAATYLGNGDGLGQRFEGGSIMASPTYGAWAILNGSIRDDYWARGGPSGTIGWPTANQVCSGSTCSQTFSGGTITKSASLTAQISALYASMGGSSSPLGRPTGAAGTYLGNGDGIGQRYEGGSVMASPTYGAWAILNGAIRDDYWAQGGPSGTIGWPTANQVCTGTTCSQTFSGGTITKTASLTSQIATLHSSLGGNSGPLGTATSVAIAYSGNGDGMGQRFTGGSVMASPTYGAWAILNGAIRNEYWARGGPAGTIGWPTANQVCTGATCSQTFSGGTITF